MNCLLLLFVIALPAERQVAREVFSLKDESLMGFYLSEFEEYEYEELLNSSPQRLRNERYDSLNLRFVGSWPFGPAWTVRVDTARNLAFCASGGVACIFDISDPSNLVKLSDKIKTRSVIKDLFYEESTCYLYIAAGYAGLEIWDVSDFLNPQKVSSFDIDGAAFGLTVNGDYVYIADIDYRHGLRVIDVSTPSIPFEVISHDTIAFARKVAVSGNYLYVTDAAQKLWVFDVSAPFFPLEVGSYNMPGAYGIDISVDNYLYVTALGLRVFDLSDPSKPSEVAYYEIGAPAEVVVSGDYAYLANGYEGFLVIDISDPSKPDLKCSIPTYDEAEGVAVYGDYAYVADRRSGLLVIDISDLPNQEVGYYDTPAYTLGIEISGDYAYLANESDGLRIIDVSNPGNPSEVGSYDPYDGPCDNLYRAWEVAVSGNYAYVANERLGLRIIDITDPEDPYEVSFYITSSAFDVVVSGNYAYVADATAGLKIIDISHPKSPIFVDSCGTPGQANSVAVYGDYAYVVCHIAGLCVIDISDPEDPIEVGSFDTPGSGSVAVYGDYAYLTDVSAGFWIIDISTPSNPTEVAHFDWGTKGIAISGNYAYVGDFREKTLRLIDISNPLYPLEVGNYDISAAAQDIAVSGSCVYLATGQTGLHIYENLLSGVNEENKDKEKVLKITQNIFMGTAEVRVEGLELPVVLNVYDVSGRVKEKTIIFNSSPVTVGAELYPGIYFVNVKGFKPEKIIKLR